MKKLAIAAGTSLLLGACAFAQAPAASPAAANAPAAASSAAQANPPAQMPPECAAWVQAVKPPAVTSLKDVNRIFVDSFGDDPIAQQIQAMVVAELMKSDKFVVTENRAKADAFLKGTGLEKTSIETHSYESGTAAGASGGGFHRSGDFASGGFHSSGAAINDASSSSQAVNDARASVRLVNQDGDVLWATAQESKGAKYKGASADVADKIVKQLMRDIEKFEKKTEAESTRPTAGK
jgi:hypothetical protein